MAAGNGGKRPLVADRRYSSKSTRPSATGGGPKKPATPKPRRAPRPRKPQRKHGLIAGFFLAIWRIFWGIAWRGAAIGGLVLGGIVWYFYAQLPPVADLIDGRARGSVTLQDRNGEVFAWRGETFGVKYPGTVSP
jgi:penicillin-binding protein 1A